MVLEVRDIHYQANQEVFHLQKKYILALYQTMVLHFHASLLLAVIVVCLLSLRIHYVMHGQLLLLLKSYFQL